MSQVTAQISMSLDGFVTVPTVRAGNGMGDGGERIHDWMFDAKTDADARITEENFASTGAVIIGKGMFEVGYEPWGDPPPFGMPVFILTHHARESLLMEGGTTYHFVTGGIDDALAQALVAAGGKNVGVWGGADIIRQYLRAGLLDELQIHLAPILLGDGIRLFEGLDFEGIELRKTESLDTPAATHLRFKVTTR